MDLTKLIESGGHIVLPITVNDLQQFGQFLIWQTRQDLARELADAQKEVYYSMDQVMAMVNVSKRTLQRWDKNGFLKSIRVGGLVRYRKSDIDRMLEPRTM